MYLTYYILLQHILIFSLPQFKVIIIKLHKLVFLGTCENLFNGKRSITKGRVFSSFEAEPEAGALLLEDDREWRSSGSVHKFQVWKN